MYYFVVLMTMMSVALELTLVMQFPWLQRMAEKFTVVGVLLSLGMSWGVGAMFGASGMIIMTAAITSTIMTMLIYRLRLIERTQRSIAWFQDLSFAILHPVKALQHRKEV